jgi:molecular chaperone Hsp33
MGETPPGKDPSGADDDFVAAFQIEGAPIRGRIARLGQESIDPILKRHDYPRWAASLLGEALTLAVLSAASLKFEGRVAVQAQGDGPVALLFAEARSDGGIRGYLRINKDRWERMDRVNKGTRPHIPQLFGKGVLALILEPSGSGQTAYQGIVPLDGAHLSDCAQAYFSQSEQIPTRVRLAVAEVSVPGGGRRWRAGGALIQQVAGDAHRGDTSDDWETARAHFDTLTDLELADPDLSSARLLFRLYHESGVRLETPRAVADRCTCSRERLLETLLALPREEVLSLRDEESRIRADCQFCARQYDFYDADFGLP